MGPEVWVAIVAVFVSGGAIGAVGTLLAQWIIRGASPPPPGLGHTERHLLREEVAELHRHLRNMDARLDFTERLLDGALPLAPPPERMPAPELRETSGEGTMDRDPGPEGGADPGGS